DDVRLDQRAVRLEHQLSLNDKVLRAQGQKGLADAAQIGGRLLDYRAKLLEPPRSLGADLPRLEVDGHLAAEIRSEGDALRRHRIGDRICKRPVRRLEGQGIAG